MTVYEYQVEFTDGHSMTFESLMPSPLPFNGAYGPIVTTDGRAITLGVERVKCLIATERKD